MSTAITVLSSGLKKDKDKGWISTPIGDLDEKSGAPGGDVRILAAAYVFQKNRSWPVIVTGGSGSEKNWENEARPLLSQVLKKELIEHGVPAAMIIEENASNTTREQLVEIAKLIKQRGFDKVLLISSRYHLPRIEAFIENSTELNDLAGLVDLLPAEDIVIENNPEWEKIIDAAYQGERMKKIMQSERQGVSDIESGNYKK